MGSPERLAASFDQVSVRIFARPETLLLESWAFGFDVVGNARNGVEAGEKVARLHLDALGVGLTELSKEQAEYLGVDVAGPYKADMYRY